MSMADYERASELISRNPEKAYFVGPRPEALVILAEQRLGMDFPDTYRRFLLEYGAGSFGSREIYGVIDQFDDSSVPDAIWYTIVLRKQAALPDNLIVVSDLGDGAVLCLDISSQRKDSSVITFQPGFSPKEQRRELIAPEFGVYLLEIAEREVGSNLTA